MTLLELLVGFVSPQVLKCVKRCFLLRRLGGAFLFLPFARLRAESETQVLGRVPWS